MNPLSVRKTSYLMRYFLILAGAILIFSGLYLFVNFDAVSNIARAFLEKHISQDNHVSERNYLTVNLYFIIVALFAMGIILLSLLHDTIRYKIKSIIFLDYACQSKVVVSRPIFTFFVSSLGGLSFIVFFILQKVLSIQQYYIEGPFEIFSEILLTISMIFLLKAAFHIRKSASQEKRSVLHGVFWFYIVLTLVTFFALMEEISWGQTIFGWKTPAFIAEINYQQETNIHNFFNPYFDSAYRVLSLVPIPIFIAAFLHLTPHETRWYDLVFPHPSLIVLATLLSFFSIGIVKNELIEELLYLFIFFYSFRVMHCSRSLTAKISSDEEVVVISQL